MRDLQQLRDEADRLAFAEPSPDALREYRRANSALAEAQRAFALASADPAPFEFREWVTTPEQRAAVLAGLE